MTNRVHLRLPFALSAAALVALAGGCDDRQSSADKAIHAQAREMHALSADSPSPSMPDVEATKLSKLSTELTPHLGSGTAGEKAAASMMIAQSNLTLAEHAMGEAAGHVTTMGNTVSEVDGYLGLWRKHQAVKEAAASYDPAPQLAEIAAGKAQKDTEAAAERQRKAQLEAQLNDLTAKVNQRSEQVAQRETQYAALKEQAAKVSATDGVPLIEQANIIKREADTLRMAATKLQAQADVIAPQVRESAAIISQLENQKKDMEATEAALAKHLADSKAEAAAAGAEAEKAAVLINQTLARVDKAQQDAEAAFTSAQSAYSKGVQSAREAAKDSPTAGKALLGDAQLATAYMHWQRSHALRVYGALLNSLANVKPALPESAAYAARAAETLAAAKAASDSAAESLEQAKSSFDSTRAQGSAKERLEALSKLLETAISVSKDHSTTVSPELAALAGMNAPAATLSATPDAPGAPAGGADPRATLTALIAAINSNDQAAMMSLVDLPAGMRKTLQPVEAASTRLDGAFKAKFGKTLAEAAGGAGAMGGMGAGMNPMAGADALKSLDPATVQIEVTGETARATSGSTTINFKKVGNNWLIYFPEVEAMAPQMAMMGPMMDLMAKAMNEIAAEVESGAYPTADAAIAALGQKVQAAMMGGMKPPGGG